MPLVLKIAWRNIWRHKGKCLVIGLILFLGAFFMTVGNSIISGMNAGLTENIVNSFTGDIVIISDEQDHNNVLLDMMSGKPLKVIRNYEAVEQVMDDALVHAFLPATAGVVMGLEPGAEMITYMLLGVNIERYQQMFPGNFRVTEGRVFNSGERGILIPELVRTASYEFLDYWFVPQGESLVVENLMEDAFAYKHSLELRSDLVFMGSSHSGSFFDVQVPVTGIIEYRALNKIWGNYAIVDIESFREAHNYVTGADSAIEVSEDRLDLLALNAFDELFDFDDLLADTVVEGDSFNFEELQQAFVREDSPLDLDAGSFNLVFVKLAEGVSQKDGLAHLNQVFSDNNLNVRAVSWQDSVGLIGSMAVMVKAALNIFVMCIFFVAIIIIMNTLSMAALERVTEIGMMRAIGARKGFLKTMFLCETGMLSFFFGGLGIAAGVTLVYFLRAANITTENEILQLVYGGNSFHPILTATDFLIGVTELGIVTVLSVLYPLRVVGKIVPLDAVARD